MNSNISQKFQQHGQKRITECDMLEDSDIDFFLLLLIALSKYKPFSTLLLHLGLVSKRSKTYTNYIFIIGRS